MAELTIGEARNNFSSLIADIVNGRATEHVIRKRDVAVAKIVPVGFLWLPIDRASISEYEKLDTSCAEGIHRDPFDRMLIAQARAANMMLVTHDKVLRLYNEPNVMVF